MIINNNQLVSCVFCNSPALIFDSTRDVEIYDCTRCGSYEISGTISAHLNSIDLSQMQIANISGWIRMNTNPRILGEDLDYLKNLQNPSLNQKADKFLTYFRKLCPNVGESLKLNLGALNHAYNRIPYFDDLNDEDKKGLYSQAKETLPLISTTWTMNPTELNYVVMDYLLNEKDFIKKSTSGFQLKPKGWEYIETLYKPNLESSVGFVAMWFNHELNNFYDSIIAPAIMEAGFKPLRIDKKEHNNKIDDEILISINKSRFIVADFTGQRGGVYFEAGYAIGKGIPVIWICKEQDLNKIHFDNRQYNFILWDDDNLETFKKRLTNRISSTISRVPN